MDSVAYWNLFFLTVIMLHKCGWLYDIIAHKYDMVFGTALIQII